MRREWESESGELTKEDIFILWRTMRQLKNRNNHIILGDGDVLDFSIEVNVMGEEMGDIVDMMDENNAYELILEELGMSKLEIETRRVLNSE